MCEREKEVKLSERECVCDRPVCRVSVCVGVWVGGCEKERERRTRREDEKERERARGVVYVKIVYNM